MLMCKQLMKNNEGWNKISKLVSKWVNVLQGGKTHLWSYFSDQIKKKNHLSLLGFL